MKIAIGIDYGLKRIGLAKSDLKGIVPKPLFSVDEDKFSVKIREIEEKGWEIEYFVIGYPLNTDGSKSTITDRVEEFIEKKLSSFGLPIFGVDERYSSIEAEEFLREYPKMKKRYGDNEIAATIILMRFFEDREYILKKWD